VSAFLNRWLNRPNLAKCNDMVLNRPPMSVDRIARLLSDGVISGAHHIRVPGWYVVFGKEGREGMCKATIVTNHWQRSARFESTLPEIENKEHRR
jgi:hypothetical protein